MRALRTSVGFPSHGDVYVLYPIADFKIEGRRFCNAGPIPDFNPAIGDELMIFCYDQPNDTTGQFLPTREQQLIFERGGKLYASKPLRSDPELLRTTGLSEIERRAKAGRDDRSLR